MTRQDRERLNYFLAENDRPVPKGMGGVATSNFISRGWIERSGQDPDTGHQLHCITKAGFEALCPKEEN